MSHRRLEIRACASRALASVPGNGSAAQCALACVSHVPARALRVLALAVAGLFLAGCETVGNGAIAQLDASAAQALLVAGKTTQADVRQALGQGDVLHFESGYETWHYLYRQGLGARWDAVPYVNLIAEHMHSPTKELVLLFDPDGTLRRWSFDASRDAASATGRP